MKDEVLTSEKQAPPDYRRFMIALLIGGSFIIGSMAYVGNLSGHVSMHSRIKDITNQIMIDMSIVHLWLEESVNGNADMEEEKIQPLIDNVSLAFKELDKLNSHSHLFLAHPELDRLPSLLRDAETTFSALKIASIQCLSSKKNSGIGSQPDQQYKNLFKSFNWEMNTIRNVLDSSLAKHLKNLENIEIVTGVLSLFIMFYGIILMLSLLKAQRQHFSDELESERHQHALEDKYRSLIEQSPFSIQIMSPDGSFLTVNKAWEKLWRTSKSTLAGYNMLGDPLLQEHSFFNDLKRGFSGENIISDIINLNPHETISNTSPYTSRYVRVHMYPIRNNDDSIAQIVIIHADVNENHVQRAFQQGQSDILKKISDPSISLSEILTQLVSFTESLSPNMAGCILLLDESRTCLQDFAGPNIPKRYRQAVNGIPIGPNVGSCGTAAFTKKRVIVSDISTDPLWRAFKETAEEFNFKSCWSEPIIDTNNNVLGTFAMYFRDCREPQQVDLDLLELASELSRNAIIHKQSMESILASEEALKEAQKLAHTGNWERNLIDGSFSFSDEMGRVFEIPKQRDVHTHEILMDSIHPEDFENVSAAYQAGLASKKPREASYRLRFEDGHIKHVTSRFETKHDLYGNPTKVVGTIQDITEIVEAQAEKEATISKMEHVQRLESLGVLAGGIAHDFNNILTAILGNAELARGKLKETSVAHPYIQNITQSSQKAADLCKQMLAYSGKGKFVIKPIILSELVEELSQLLHVTIAKNIVLRLDLSKQLPAIDADVTQMQQVIMNLVINASEAIGENSGALSISTGVVHMSNEHLASTFVDEHLEEGQYVYLEVSDTGCGMDETTKSKIFEPFFTTKFTGRGLGMAAILGIIRGHNGAIKTYSELGKGTTFKIFLPRSSRAPEHISLDTGLDKKAWTSKGCVLIIDDEETIREVAISMLSDMGLETMTACDGVEGMEIYKKHHHQIDAILLDMTMPRMGGEDTFSELCQINPDVKVILSSGYNEQDATNRFAGKGLAGFLQKPYTPSQLATKLAKIFDET